MKFTFVEDVDTVFFERTKAAWIQQIDDNPEDTSRTHYDAVLDYLGRAVAGEVLKADGGGCVCAIVENGNDYAVAMIVVSHARANSSLRMLDVHVQPSLNLADREPNRGELAWIAAKAIVGCLGLTYDKYPSKELKIHSAFPLDKEFLSAVATVLLGIKEFSEAFEVKSAGNWIVVSKKPENGDANAAEAVAA